jgi:2-phosphoglycolate phosphatase
MGLTAVLFDLDGTLLDTAPDMVGALNALRAEESLAPMPYDAIRSVVSHGAARVVKTGFPQASPESLTKLQQRFLEIYRGALSRETRLFPGMDEVLDALAGWRIKSGIVTNKPAWLTEPLLAELGLRARFACVVSGDTLAERKPHPLPVSAFTWATPSAMYKLPMRPPCLHWWPITATCRPTRIPAAGAAMVICSGRWISWTGSRPAGAYE